MLSNDLLNGAKAASDFVGVTPRVIYALVEQEALPFRRIGKRLYFRKSELEAAFRSQGAA